jgi:hypothetical protein
MESIAFVVPISSNDFLGNKIHTYQVVGQCLKAHQIASPAHPTIGAFLGSKQRSDVNAGVFHGIGVEIEIMEHLSHVPRSAMSVCLSTIQSKELIMGRLNEGVHMQSLSLFAPA